MARIIGRRGHGSETYPTRLAEGAVPLRPSFAFDQNTTSYTAIDGEPPIQIAVATISLTAGSRVKIEAMASVQGSVAAGRALIATPSIGSSAVAQSFDTTEGTNDRILNFLGITGPQPDGPLSIGITIQVLGNAGARVDSIGLTVLTLTEIPAP